MIHDLLSALRIRPMHTLALTSRTREHNVRATADRLTRMCQNGLVTVERNFTNEEFNTWTLTYTGRCQYEQNRAVLDILMRHRTSVHFEEFAEALGINARSSQLRFNRASLLACLLRLQQQGYIKYDHGWVRS